jgi:hypothetical protein
MSERLQYYIHDEPDAFRLELSGILSGEGAESVYHAWRTALSILGERPLSIDITFVRDADERGRSLLLLWHQHGARIVAASRESRAIAGSILGVPFPEPAAKPGLFQRLGAWLRGRVAAESPACAEQPTRRPASSSKNNAGINGVSRSANLECRVP